MNDSFEMEVLQAIENLTGKGFCDVFVEPPTPMKAAANAASRYVLQETGMSIKNTIIA